MPLTTRLFGAALTALTALAVASPIAPIAGADPDIDSESAAEVVTDLEEQGYDVQVKGVSGDATDMLTSCKVTSMNASGEQSPDPTRTTVIYVEVACPIQHS